MENPENTLLTLDNVATDVVLSFEDFESLSDDAAEETSNETSVDAEDTDSTEEDNSGTEDSTDEGSSEDAVPDTADSILAETVYQSLVERGLLAEDEKFDKTFTYIESKLDDLPDQLLTKGAEKLPEYSRSLYNYMVTAGENLSKEELNTFIREFIGEQDVPDVSTLDTAREFMETQLKEQGLRPSAIEAQLDELEASDELITEAEKILSSAQKKTAQLSAEKIAENEQIKESQKLFYESVKHEIAETKWDKKQQDKVLQTIPKTNEIFNKLINKPKAYVQLMDFLAKFDGEEFDLEVYRKQGESRTTSKMQERLNAAKFSSATTGTSATTPKKTDDFLGGFKPVI